MTTRIVIAALLAAVFLAPFALAEDEDMSSGERLKIATTTSLYDTRLLDVLETMFENEHSVSLDIIAKGTGIAIEYGERGDVDLLMVHDKEREIKFVDEGHGLERRCFAYNYFWLVGPADDPAAVAGKNASMALKAIMEMGMEDPSVSFVSRGDNSGTHAREKLLWKNAGLDYETVRTSGPWYAEAGLGMGETLNMANEKDAYTLCDMSTFKAFQGNLTIVPLIEGSDDLINVYVAMAIDPATHPNVNCQMANEFINFLVSDEAQDVIATYGTETIGQPLFFPARGNCELIGCSETECAAPTTAPCTA
ncbi:MAG: solute-binding protein [Methanosarcinales archaeon]|nr:solute-binding protein [Methanosarcinales archaeon]